MGGSALEFYRGLGFRFQGLGLKQPSLMGPSKVVSTLIGVISNYKHSCLI